MSMTDQLTTTSHQVEGLRDGLGRLRDMLDQTDSILDVADGVLEKADDVLGQAVVAVEQGRRWAPRVGLIVGLLAAAGITAVVVHRLRQRESEA